MRVLPVLRNLAALAGLAALFGCPQDIKIREPDARDAGVVVRDGGAEVSRDGGPAAPTCGDDRAEGNEVCDGIDLKNETCATQRIGTGDLACNSDCDGFDTAGCVACEPTCGALECGPDPTCGISCGDCGMGEDCSAAGICVETCEPGSFMCTADGFGWQGCGLDDSSGLHDFGPRIACPNGIACGTSPCMNAPCQSADVVVIVDRSASMSAGSVWSWTRDTVVDVLGRYDIPNRIGAREFPGGASCFAAPLITPAVDNLMTIDSALTAPGADASSPIVGALDGLAPVFTGRHDAMAVVLITDGAESCQGEQDALDAASRLFRIGVKTYPIGLTTRADQAFLDRLAAVGGTTARHADDAVALDAALEEIFADSGACPNPRAQVTSGYYHACGRHTDGTLACWGRNQDGQATPPAGQYVDVAASTDAVCAIDTLGRLNCWGRDLRGQIDPPTNGVYTQVSGGDSHFCALAMDGTAHCWGYDDAGQATPPTGTFKQIAVGNFFSCGLRTDGSVECWGQPRPPTPAGNEFIQISAGRALCGLQGDRNVVCTGGLSTGIPAGPFSQVAAGQDHACAVRTSGEIACWGSDFAGQSTPDTNHLYTQVAVNNAYTCAVTTENAFVCWGEGGNGQTTPP